MKDGSERARTLSSIVSSLNSDIFPTVEKWEQRLRTANATMLDSRSNRRALIEVAAQHPLREGYWPNAEFEERLSLGIKLFEDFSSEVPVEIYVPGSRHSYQGVEDSLTLSEAGARFLIEAGVPRNQIRGDDLNHRYCGEKGVYGSAAECYVTARYFLDGEFGQLVSVVSPTQLTRKLLHYIEFAVFPKMYSVPTADMFHNILDEVFVRIPNAIFHDSLVADDTQGDHQSSSAAT